MFRPIPTELYILLDILKLFLTAIEQNFRLFFVHSLCWTRTFTYGYTLIKVNGQDQKLLTTGIRVFNN